MMVQGGHIFISYARRDGGEYASKLESILLQHGIKTWRDTRGIDPTQDFTAEIEEGVESAYCIVACITPDTKRADSFVRREIGYGLLRNKPIIVARFDDVTPPISIVNHTWLDFFRDWDKAFAELRNFLDQSGDSYRSYKGQQVDPFRSYLQSLYRQIVEYLSATVFTFIPLRTNAIPDAMEKKVESRFLASFFGSALTIRQPVLSEIERTEIRFESFTEAFEYYRGRLLLIGEPGAGKTTTLLAFARDAVAKRLEDPSQPLPLLARISDWPTSTMPSFGVWLGNNIGIEHIDGIKHVLMAGQGLLLLDGLDELGNKYISTIDNTEVDPRTHFLRRIPPNNSIVVTCRSKDYKELGEQLEVEGVATLMPLDDAQLEAYMAGNRHLFAAIQHDQQLINLVRTPLLLSLFTYAFSNIDRDMINQLRNLRDSSKELREYIFRVYIERRFEHERLKLGTSLVYELETTYSILGQISMNTVIYQSMHSHAIMPATVDSLLGGDSSLFIEEMKKLNLLIEDRGSLRFVHFLLRDHFYSQQLLPSLQSTDKHLIFRAVKALGALPLEDDKILHQLRILLKTNFDLDVLQEIVKTLGKYGDKGAVKYLIDMLNRWRRLDYSLAITTVQALGQIGDNRAVEVLERVRLSIPIGDLEAGREIPGSGYRSLGYIAVAVAFIFLLVVLLSGIVDSFANPPKDPGSPIIIVLCLAPLVLLIGSLLILLLTTLYNEFILRRAHYSRQRLTSLHYEVINSLNQLNSLRQR